MIRRLILALCLFALAGLSEAAKIAIAKASTNVTVYIFVQDSSATDGSGLTGLVWNSASLVASQVRPLAARVAITLATQTVTGAHSDGGFVEIDATNMPGIYRLDLPDAVCATGVDSAVVMLKGATNMAPVVLEIQLTDFDLNDGVRGGLTALPNAAADAAGGLVISDAGGLDIDALNTNINDIETDTGTTLDNHLTDIKGTAFVKDTHSLIDIETYVDLIDDGTSGLAKIATDAAAILVDTSVIGAAGAGLTAVPWNAAWDAEVESEVDDALGVAGADLTAVPWNAAWDAEVESEVDDSLGAGTGTSLTAIPWNASWDTEVESEANDALVAARLDELLNADSDIDGAAPPTDGSVFQELMTSAATGFTWVQSTDSMQGIRDNQIATDGSGLTAVPWNAAWDAEVESEVDDSLGAGTGTSLTAVPWNAAWDAEVESEVEDAVGADITNMLAIVQSQ